MKRALLLILMLALVLGTGCSTKDKPGVFTEKDFALVNLENNKTISIGMDKAAAEEVFDNLEKKEDTRLIFKKFDTTTYESSNYENFTVIYKNDLVIGISLSNYNVEGIVNTITTSREISIGSSCDKVHSVYGKTDINGGLYVFAPSDKKSIVFKKKDDVTGMVSTYDNYLFTLMIDSSGQSMPNINWILIGNKEFADFLNIDDGTWY